MPIHFSACFCMSCAVMYSLHCIHSLYIAHQVLYDVNHAMHGSCIHTDATAIPFGLIVELRTNDADVRCRLYIAVHLQLSCF